MRVMKFYLIISLLLLQMGFAVADERNANVLVLDVSKGMQDSLDGVSKLSLLKEAIPQFLEEWPEDEKLAVLAYGKRSKESCEKITTLNTVESVNKEELLAKVSKLKASGRAPLISAIYKAEKQLKNRKGNIILITEGKDNCRKMSVCKVAKRMKKNHPDIYIHTVDIQGDNETLQCIAEATGGEYRSIQNISNLASTLFSLGEVNSNGADEEEGYSEHTGRLVLNSTEVMGGEPVPASYIIYSDDGKHIASYTAQKEVDQTLPIGSYTVTAIYNLLEKETKLKVNTDAYVGHTFIYGESGTLNLSSRYRGRPTSTLYTIYNKNGIELVSSTSESTFTQTLPVGTYKVEAKHDGDKKILTVNIKKGSVETRNVRF